MDKKTSAALILQRSEWFDKTSNLEAIKELEEDGDRIVYKLNPFLDITHTWSVFSADTVAAVSIELRSLDVDLIILVYQTRVDEDFFEKLLKGVGTRPLVAWCYLPWRRIPQPMTYEDLVKGSSLFGMTASLAHLRDLKVPYLAAFGSADDPQVLSNIEEFARAAHVANKMARMQLGILSESDDPAEADCFLSSFGLAHRPIPLSGVEASMKAIQEGMIDSYLAKLTALGIESMVTDETLRQGVRATLAVAHLAQENGLDFLAVPDHDPAFRAWYGLCPGMPPGLDDGDTVNFIPTVDHGAIASSVALSAIASSPVFMMRMWFWDRAKNIVVGGYGGLQNPNGISNGPMLVCGDYECSREDPDGGAQLEFIARPGRITLLQICNSASGCRAMAASGICLESDPRIEGIPHAVVRLDCSIEYFLQQMAEFGASAYWVMGYGDHIAKLKALFALKEIRFDVLRD